MGGEVVGGQAGDYAVANPALMLGVGREGEFVPEGFFDCCKEVTDEEATAEFGEVLPGGAAEEVDGLAGIVEEVGGRDACGVLKELEEGGSGESRELRPTKAGLSLLGGEVTFVEVVGEDVEAVKESSGGVPGVENLTKAGFVIRQWIPVAGEEGAVGEAELLRCCLWGGIVVGEEDGVGENVEGQVL